MQNACLGGLGRGGEECWLYGAGGIGVAGFGALRIRKLVLRGGMVDSCLSRMLGWFEEGIEHVSMWKKVELKA